MHVLIKLTSYVHCMHYKFEAVNFRFFNCVSLSSILGSSSPEIKRNRTLLHKFIGSIVQLFDQVRLDSMKFDYPTVRLASLFRNVGHFI